MGTFSTRYILRMEAFGPAAGYLRVLLVEISFARFDANSNLEEFQFEGTQNNPRR